MWFSPSRIPGAGRRWPELWLLLAILAFSTSASGGDRVLLVNTSEQMAAACPGEGSPYSRELRNAVRQLMGKRSANRRNGLIQFGSEARVLAAFDERVTDVIRRLPEPGGRYRAATLPRGLALARNLLRKARTPAELIIVGDGAQPDASDQLAQQVAMLRGAGTNVTYVAVGALHPDAIPGLQSIYPKVSHHPCPRVSGGAAADPRLLTELRQLAARLSGIPAALFAADTEFLSELQMDRFTAYEIMSAACAEQAVVTPQREDLTSLRKLAAYIESAPLLTSPGDRVVRGADSGKGAREAVHTQTVFYATNRKRARGKRGGETFGGGRAFKGRISYGRCEVSIPPAKHQRGSLETPFLSLDYFADPQKHVLLRKVDVFDQKAFLKALRSTLSRNRANAPDKDDILVFIHGFNVSFENAARRTAQIAYDLGFNGAPVFFSWPSNGEFFAYISDREDVAWSVPHIADFLRTLVRDAGGDRVHIVAHSMGHEGLLRALNQLVLERGKKRTPLFENIIMAAPDFDAEIFADQIAPRIRTIAKNWTLYASDKDLALNVSSKLRFAIRLGLPLTVVPDVVTVDATGVEVTPWSVPEFHSYYASKQRVITDIISVLRGKSPQQRPLVQAKKGRLPYWRLKGG